MPVVSLTRRWDYNRMDMTAEQYAAKHGFVTEFAKNRMAASLKAHQDQLRLHIAKEEQANAIRRSQEAALLESLAQSLPPVTPPPVTPPPNPRIALSAASSEAARRQTRNSDRLSGKKRESREFTLGVHVDKLLHKQVIYLIQPSMDCRIAHLPVSTTNFPERLTPKASLTEMYGEQPYPNRMAEIQVTASHHRLDITAVRPSSAPTRAAQLPTGPTPPPVGAAETVPSHQPAPRKFEMLMEQKGRKRSFQEVEALSKSETPESVPEPSISPCPSVSDQTSDSGPRTRAARLRAQRESVPLYAFILSLLASGQNNDAVQWTRHTVGEFKIIDSSVVAKLWGRYRGNVRMTYDKMARALRYYYDGPNPILESVSGRSLTYRFTHDSKNRIQGHAWADLLRPGTIKSIITTPVRATAATTPDSTSGSDSSF